MYELNGEEITLEFLQGKAQEYNMSFEDYIEAMKNKGLVEKTNGSQIEDATAEPVSTASKLEDTSSGSLPRISGFDKAGFGYQPIGEQKAEDEKSLATGLIKAIGSLKDPVQREVAKYYMKNRIDNIPENLLSAAVSAKTAITDLVTADLDGLGYNEKQEKVREEAEEVMKSSYDKLEDLELQMKDTGKGIVGGIRSGQGADLVAGVFSAGISMAETVVPAFLTFGVSLPVQVSGPMYTEYNKSKAKALYGDDPNAIDKLIANDETEIATPLALGALATGLEYVGYKGVTKYIANSGIKGAKVAKLMYTSSGEGFTEVGQLGTEVINESLAAGDTIEQASRKSLDAMFSDEGLEMWLNGFLGATQMSVGGRALNRAIRSDKASVTELNNKISNLADLNLAKNTTTNKAAKNAIDIEIKEAEQDLKNYITEKRKIKDILNEDQKASLIDIIGQQDNLRKQAEDLKFKNENGEINNKDFGYAIRAINNQNKRLIEQIETINAEAKQLAVEQQVETVEKQVEELAKIGVEGKVTRLTAEEISNVQEENFDAEAASKQFGFIKQFGDGSFEIVLNEDKPAIGTAAHEFLHAVLYKSIGADNTIQDNLGDALVEHVSKLGGDKSALAERLSKYGTFNTKGEFVRDANFGEETITIMSESIVDGSLKFDEGFFTKIGDFVRRFLQDKGIVGIKFDTGRDVFNFVKDYSKSISEGKVSKAILNVAKEGVKGKLVEGKEDAKPTTQFSKIYQEVEAMKADLINPSTKQGTAFIAADALSNEVDRRLPRIEGITAEERADIVRNFVLDDNRGLVGLLNNYNPDRNDSIMGYLNSSTPGGKLLDARLQEFYKDDPRFGQIFQTTTDEAVATKVERETAIEEETADLSETGRKTKGVIIGKVLNISKKASEIIKPKYEQHRSSIVNLANTPMLLTELVSEISGIPVKKLKTQANLNQHLAPAQMAAAKNAQLLLQMLPKQHTTKRVKVGKDKDGDPIYEVRPDKSTKVPQKVLDFFYNKGVRKDNLTPYTLKRNLSEKDIIEFAGVVDGTRSKDENRYYQQNLLGLWRLFDRVFSNQELRIEGEKRGETPTALQTLREGNRQILFSKAVRDLSVDKQSILFEKISEVGAGINPAYVNVKNTKDVVRSLKEIYGEDLTTRELNKIAKELGRLADVYEPVISNNKVIPEKTWTEFVADSFDQAADNIIEALGLTIDGSTPTAASLYDNIEFVARGRRAVIELGNDLLEKGKSIQDVARIMAVLKPMYASSSKIGRGKISVDENGNLFVVDGNKFGSPRGQVFNNVKDFENNAVLKIQGMTPEIWKSTNKKLLAQKSKDAIKNTNYDQRLLEAKEAREAIDLMMNFFNDSEFHNDLDIAMFMISNLSNMGAPLRRAANLQYIADAVLKMNINDLGKLAEYEHLIPANYMAIKIIQAYKSGEKVNVDNLYKNYKVAVIPKTMDDVIKRQGLQSKMHAGYNFDNDPSTDRYYNFLTRGFDDIVPIRDISNKQLVGVAFSKAGSDVKISENISNVRPVLQYSKKSRGMSTFDFDETLIIDGKNFVTATKGEDVVKIPSDKWPIDGPKLAAEGYKFDFSDFANVRGGKEGPLLQKMKNQIKKYGPSNVFVLTARQQEAAEPIHKWLKSQGISIPIENITGLGKSEGDAKAQWFIDKYAEGYNDMYFVDDALPNVEAVKHVFDQLDIKGKSVQARVQFSKDMSSEFNKMLERTKGVAAEKRFSRVVGQKRGKNIGRYRFFVPPSAEDFAGLLYDFYGKGKQGDADMEFMKKALLDPFGRADREMSMARMSILDDYKMLRKELPEVKKKLGKIIDKDTGFTFDNAVRAYLFDKAGFEIPGVSKRDLEYLRNIVNTDQDLKTFADTLSIISKRKEGYIEPGENWSVETIASDLENIVNKIGRKKYLAEFIENKNIIFSPENMNKIEAVYGSRFRSALEDSLYRMENGTNRSAGRSYGQTWTNWVNGSVGAIMFFNARSAVLQTLSTVNFINFQDNNIFKAGKAFANQKQYWSDFTTLFNSDFLKARRAGLQINVNEAELANAVAGAQNRAKAALAYLLKKGFLPTQIADSFAIASGGATFYRNRIETYVKDGFSKKAAEEKAFLDFQEIAQETQQSSRPDRISQQQASPLGRLILAFANTPMQYNRLIKKAARDLINNRGDWRSNVSRILYYGAIQNVIFSAMQSAIFALSFDDEEDDELDKRTMRIANGMMDTILRGSGVTGAAVATIKNAIMRFVSEAEKESRADYGQVVVEALQVSPPMGSKARKLYSALNAYKFNRDIMGSMDTFDYNNPIWDAAANVTTAATNVPLDRLFRKTDNIKEAFNQENSAMQRTFLLLGWSSWDLQVGERVVVNKGKKNEYVKYLDTKRQAQQKAEEELKEAKKKEKQAKQQRCIARTSSGRRCKNMVNKPKTRCYAHD